MSLARQHGQTGTNGVAYVAAHQWGTEPARVLDEPDPAAALELVQAATAVVPGCLFRLPVFGEA